MLSTDAAMPPPAQTGNRLRDGDQLDGAISVRTFCQRNSIGLTTAYAEIKAGRLVARKCRSRTLIALEDERAWRNNLPKVRP